MTRTRRKALAAAAIVGTAAAHRAAAPPAPPGGETGGAGRRPATCPTRPSEPVTLNILDVAGNLQLTQRDDRRLRGEEPRDRVQGDHREGHRAGAGRQGQGRSRTPAASTSTWCSPAPTGCPPASSRACGPRCCRDFADRLVGMENYLEPAAAMQELAGDQGVVVTYYPSGPLHRVRARPRRHARRRPPRSCSPTPRPTRARSATRGRPTPGPGRTFLMGLPYMLGDNDPKDPDERLGQDLGLPRGAGQDVTSYPSGTAGHDEEPGQRHLDIIASTTGWDINPRALGTVPEESRSARSTASPGSPTRTTRSSQGRLAGQAGRAAGPDRSSCSPRSSRPRPTTRATSTRARRSRTSTLRRWRRREPGRDRAVRPPRVRRADRRATRRRRRSTPRTWSPRSTGGTARSAAARSSEESQRAHSELAGAADGVGPPLRRAWTRWSGWT